MENALNEHNIRFVKIDGSSTRERRGMIVQQFQEERDIKVMLLTYASGSVGYVKSDHTISLHNIFKTNSKID
jgi:SNF2 family DNA or RNA helicase